MAAVCSIAVILIVVLAMAEQRRHTSDGENSAHDVSSKQTESDCSAEKKISDDCNVMSERTKRTIANGDVPDWDDLTDREKTALSVWSEKGGPLEDIHHPD